MIKAFADRPTRELFTMGTAKPFPPDVARRAARKLEYVDLATSLDDLKAPPGNRLHALKEDRQGQHAIAVNDHWRTCFRSVADEWAISLRPLPVEEAMTAGRINDLQGAFNLNTLWHDGKVDGLALERFKRLMMIVGVRSFRRAACSTDRLRYRSYPARWRRG